MRHTNRHTNQHLHGNADERLTIRRAMPSDRGALERLAERDSSKALSGEILLAEVDGHPLAAVSLDGGRGVADPFARSGEAMSMLRARRRQLLRRGRGHARAALAGSPPGAGGRLLVLPPR